MYNFIRNIRLGDGFTIFVLFFGVATLEAFESGNWIRAAFWLAIAIAFLAADSRRWTVPTGKSS